MGILSGPGSKGIVSVAEPCGSFHICLTLLEKHRWPSRAGASAFQLQALVLGFLMLASLPELEPLYPQNALVKRAFIELRDLIMKEELLNSALLLHT
jgi:hypothetical protein